MININDYGFPFNSVTSDRIYGAAEWREYFDALVTGGIVGDITNELQVKPQAVPNKTVYVDTGAIMIKGAMRSLITTEELALTDNTSGNPRIDRIIARLNYTDRKIEFVVKEGTPGVSPAAPALTRNETAWELSLAQIAVANSYSTITVTEITDERADESLCGYFKYRAKPAWYPGGDVPIDAWMYTVFRNQLTAEEIADIEANPTLMAIINAATVAPTETVTVTVSADDSTSVAGQTISLTDLSVSAESQTYVLQAGESSKVFRVTVGHFYYVNVDSKSLYAAPSQSATFEAIAGYARNIALQYQVLKRYGFRRTKATQDPANRIEYLYDAVGLTPAYTNLSTGVFEAGGWGTFIGEVQRQVMLKNDGTVDYELDPTNDTKKIDGVTASDVSNIAYAGNAMVAFRKYKWVYRYEDATYEYVIFSNGQYDANYKAYAHQNALGTIKDEFYWGKYKGIYSTNLRSIADQAVMVSQTRDTEVSRATANGSGYYTIYKSGWDYICDLLTLISKSDSSQSKFGTGRSKTTNTTAIATGTRKSNGLFWGSSDELADVKVFGIEGFWGNVWEGMAGLVFNGNIKTKLTPPYNFDGSAYTDTGLDPSGTSGGYVSQSQNNDASGWIPLVASGSSSTYFCDGLWFNKALVGYALVGGDWSSGGLDGSRYVDLRDLASAVDASLGSRLSFLDPA